MRPSWSSCRTTARRQPRPRRSFVDVAWAYETAEQLEAVGPIDAICRVPSSIGFRPDVQGGMVVAGFGILAFPYRRLAV